MNIGKLLGVAFGIFVAVLAMSVVQDTVATVPEGEMSGAEQGLLDILPVVVAAAVITGSMGILVSKGPEFMRKFKWAQYGNRIKRAYTAKFGGQNTGFNDEVDLRIKIMRDQGEGHTMEIAESWLKRIAEFVEIPWKDLGSEASIEETGGEDYEYVEQGQQEANGTIRATLVAAGKK